MGGRFADGGAAEAFATVNEQVARMSEATCGAACEVDPDVAVCPE
jgi:hypothetical protein